MTTRDDVIDAINRIERAGHAGEATQAAQLEVLLLPPQEYDGILNRLRAAFPELFPPSAAGRPLPRSLPRPPSAPPDEAGQQGTAVQAMKKAEAALSQQQSATAEFDRQVIEALLHAHKTTTEGRAQLDDLENQIENAARTWDLSTTAGAREFQRFLIGKLRQIVAVVQDTNDDATSKQALAAAWAALYAAQTTPDGPGESAGDVRDGAPGAGDVAHPDPVADTYPDSSSSLPEDDPEPVAESGPPRGAPGVPVTPAAPGLGGGMPSAGLSPAGGLPFGLPSAGFMPGLQPPPPREHVDDAASQPDELASAHEPTPEEAGDKEVDDGAPAAPEPTPGAGPTTVKLPDGDMVTAPTPQLAAVVRAAAGGTPISDAFRQQGITIPPPGTAVTGQVDPSRVRLGDIGMFTDRHALAVGNSKALLDGEIHYIDDVRGPSFLGWQHPPVPIGPAEPAQTPTPTRPSATVRA